MIWRVGLSAFLLLLLGVSAQAQSIPPLANVVSSCGTPNTTYSAGQNKPVTQDTNGKMCDSGGSGSVIIQPSVVTTTDDGGTITSGGVAQNAIAANSSRKGWCIQNDPLATEVLNVRANGTASATTGASLSPGAMACNQATNVDQTAISVYAATTGHRWYGWEVQ